MTKEDLIAKLLDLANDFEGRSRVSYLNEAKHEYTDPDYWTERSLTNAWRYAADDIRKVLDKEIKK